MFKKISHTWNQLSLNGVRPEHTYEDIKRIKIINQSSVVGLANTLMFAIILIFLSLSKLIKLEIEFGFIFDLLFLLVLAIFSFTNFWLIKKYPYNVAAIFLLTSIPTILLTLNIVFDKMGAEYYYFPFFILLFYLLRNRRGLIIISVYYIFLFTVANYFDTYFHKSFIHSDRTQVFYFANIIVSFISCFAFLSLFISEYEKKQKEIGLKNTLLVKAVETANQKSAEIQLLLKELSHRTKNNLQLVSSIINIQSGKITDATAKSTIDDTRDRIFAMALLHQKLYVNNNLNTFSLSDYAVDLINYLIDIFDDKSNQVKIIKDIDKIDMKIDNAIHIGLVINEILTNSFKHGMSKAGEKFIKVCVKKIEDYNIVISISDSGEGITQIAHNNYSGSFGGSLIFSLVKQMDGEISFNEVAKNEVIIRLKNIV